MVKCSLMIKQQFTNMFSNICKKIHIYTQREDGKLCSKLLTVIVFKVGFISFLTFFHIFFKVSINFSL